MNDKPAKPAIEMLTLKQLCAEIKSRPARGARETSFGYTRLKEKSRTREVAQARTYVGVAEELTCS